MTSIVEINIKLEGGEGVAFFYHEYVNLLEKHLNAKYEDGFRVHRMEAKHGLKND